MEKDGASDESDRLQWFVMRDLKRRNAKLPAYKLLDGMVKKVFTPMVWMLVTRHGKRVKEQVPFIQDLLFVYDTRQAVDPIVEKYDTVQYRYVRGGYKIPMTVREADMQRFIDAVNSGAHRRRPVGRLRRKFAKNAGRTHQTAFRGASQPPCRRSRGAARIHTAFIVDERQDTSRQGDLP